MNKKLLIIFIFSLLIAISTVKYVNRETPHIEVSSSQISDQKAQEASYFADFDINYLKSLEIDSQKPVIEQELSDGTNYKRYIASYISDGNKIYGLLTLPKAEAPEGGFSAIVFNHGYIPPDQYVTTEKYTPYVDYLARNGFVVFKIDLRGHGDSEGKSNGSYFSSDYTIDAINAFKSLQKLEYINKDKIGMWGHSMAGNLVLRAMEVEPEIAAGVIWGGAVYSYEDFATYRLSDRSYVRSPDAEERERERPENVNKEISALRQNPEEIDFNNAFWKAVSLTQNINYLNSPIQLNHAINDEVVNIGYARDLAKVLDTNGKTYEMYEYSGGGHNIDSPYFEQAMVNTVTFFKKYL